MATQDYSEVTVVNTEETRAGAMACKQVLKVMEQIADGNIGYDTHEDWWNAKDAAIASMINASGVQPGFLYGFIAALAEFIHEINTTGTPYADDWEPEATMTGEEIAAKRAKFEEECDEGNKDISDSEREEILLQQIGDARELAQSWVRGLPSSADNFREKESKFFSDVLEIVMNRVTTDGGYRMSEEHAARLREEVGGLVQAIAGCEVEFSEADHEEKKGRLIQEAFERHVSFPEATEKETLFRRFSEEFIGNRHGVAS